MAFVGKLSDVAPGRLLAIDLDGQEVAVANVGGRLFAVGGVCSHQGCLLADGELEGAVVVCPCHGGQFDVTTGGVVAGPPRDPVATYPVQVNGDQFQVG
jgi:3-phenylpropionate/trans-cinnamate dioxygenase ferredoxin subunit